MPRTKPQTKEQCRHCGQWRSIRARGLCWTCNLSPVIRGQYPPGRTAPINHGSLCADPFIPHRLPATATDAMPGTDEKIAVMAGRADRGESVFHPSDGHG
jgi:hypothetical protein